MNRKGFTLTELIAVIVILGLIAVISVPVINGIIKRSKDRAYEKQVTEITNAARLWVTENTGTVGDTSRYILDLSALLGGKYIEESEVIDPRNDTAMRGCVIVSQSNNDFSYVYESNTSKCK